MNRFTHVAGTFLIQAEGSFLNGAGLGSGEDRNVTVPKTLLYNGKKVPYVSAQAWKRWLRNTFIEETGWNKSELRAIGLSEKGTTNKISGELNPVDFAEDDIFGYMEAKGGQGKEEEGKSNKKVRALIRTSPFMASILISLKKSECKSTDEGFVHLKEGTPQPYSTMFYATDLQGIFCLDYNRLGVFNNYGDRVELDEHIIDKMMEQDKIIEKEVFDNNKGWKIFEIKNAEEVKKARTAELLKALSVLRGGAKQAAFGTDLAPKALILAPLNCGNPIFNHLFEQEKELKLKIETFKEIVRDYKDRITGKVYVGIRKGYVSNEEEIYDLASSQEYKHFIVVTSPIEAVKRFNQEELRYK